MVTGTYDHLCAVPSRRRLSLAGQEFLQWAKPALQAPVDGGTEDLR